MTARVLAIENVLSNFKDKRFYWHKVIEKNTSLSHAEIGMSCRDAIKCTISDKHRVNITTLLEALHNRQEMLINLQG